MLPSSHPPRPEPHHHAPNRSAHAPSPQIYPLDAIYDTPADVPEDVKTSKRYAANSGFTVSEVRIQLDIVLRTGVAGAGLGRRIVGGMGGSRLGLEERVNP